MRKKDLNIILNKGFEKNLKELGFKKIKYGFIKRYEKFHIRIGYSIVDYYNIFPTTFSYRLSLNSLNNLYSSIFNKEMEVGAHSSSIVNLYEEGRYPIYEYNIKNEDDAKQMIEEVSEYLKIKTIPYLESISNFKALDIKYNTNPTEPNLGVRGLILAKMVKNPNYAELKKTYRQLFVERNWAVQEDIDDLEKVIDFLDSHTNEELEKIAEI